MNSFRLFHSIFVLLLIIALSISPSVVAADDVTLVTGTSENLPENCVPTVFQEGHPGPTDIFFLADTTGSMGTFIADVKSKASDIFTTIQGVVSDVQFGVGEYKDDTPGDCDSDPFAFKVDQSITSDTVAVQNGLNVWSASGGCASEAESYIYALQQVGLDAGIGWRPDTSKIVVWFGDAPSHDPNFGASPTTAINALLAQGVKVLAINVGVGHLDSAGQATTIVNGAGGKYVNSLAADLSKIIQDELIKIIQSEITLKVVASCDNPAVQLTFPSGEVSGVTIPTGNSVCFHPTVSASGGLECHPLHAQCTYSVVSGNGDTLNGPNTINIDVTPIADVIPPVLHGVPADATVSCDSVPAPPKVTATDNCAGDVEVHYSEVRTDGSCPNTYTLVRTWTASDSATPPNTVTASQTIHVQDTTPPSLASDNSAYSICLWPPNHKYYFFKDLNIFNSHVVDNCPGPVTVSFASCKSSQPDNTHGHNRRLLTAVGGNQVRRLLTAVGGNQGDGETTHDCVFEGGILKVRAERAGQNQSPRVYSLSLTYTDQCGNSLTTTNNNISVPHDITDVPGPCLAANN